MTQENKPPEEEKPPEVDLNDPHALIRLDMLVKNPMFVLFGDLLHVVSPMILAEAYALCGQVILQKNLTKEPQLIQAACGSVLSFANDQQRIVEEAVQKLQQAKEATESKPEGGDPNLN